ncbi:Transcriptional regulator containing an amidase domain and an AraC-type DNA-binding HTH domain [Acidisarcina polymorpha]|uniref:Transcriptional regulator containing an amidase domain and an AraC-type DNA-binding HTH domain n=1 Tax=Acidisarcina polymorpha TaxID=2211140 RepID=A0A2Z5G077_9BACT|nr:transcriptional regulator FtrA [Acidisarcina polymorpha]AXC12164.1 Transcriptional regulator containing an amidase domain and an AraC-type DNA-binding HTH domain [Acidisarcina polymorpha]
MPLNKDTKVATVVYDGLCTFEFGVAVEAFGLPRPELDGWYDFSVMACEPGPIRAVGGIVVVPQYHTLKKLKAANMIVIPGWRNFSEKPPQALLNALRKASQRGVRIVSLCSGVFVLAAAGLLDGRSATTHWKYAEKLQRDYPMIHVKPHILYIEDRGVFTSAGSAAAIDLCLHISRRDHGTKIGNAVARRLVVQPHREGGQKQFIDSPMGDEDSPWFAELLVWVHKRIKRNIAVNEMAAKLNMSPRTFARKFESAVGESPGRWILSVRIRRAKDLLETTQLSLEEVAHRCGFSDAALMRHHFVRRVGTTPSTYRRDFNTKLKAPGLHKE